MEGLIVDEIRRCPCMGRVGLVPQNFRSMSAMPREALRSLQSRAHVLLLRLVRVGSPEGRKISSDLKPGLDFSDPNLKAWLRELRLERIEIKGDQIVLHTRSTKND